MPFNWRQELECPVAQMEEHLPVTQGVAGSIPARAPTHLLLLKGNGGIDVLPVKKNLWVFSSLRGKILGFFWRNQVAQRKSFQYPTGHAGSSPALVQALLQRYG